MAADAFLVRGLFILSLFFQTNPQIFLVLKQGFSPLLRLYLSGEAAGGIWGDSSSLGLGTPAASHKSLDEIFGICLKRFLFFFHYLTTEDFL